MANNQKRIIYLDLMRAFAVFMMVQGHTIDTFLANEYRTFDSTIYSVWYTFRGFTAPIFMFTAGVVFTYLLKINKFDFQNNPRIKKGIKRASLLILIGYLLRYPTYRIFNFEYVSDAQWSIFFAVDALHLIGFGLLTIVGIIYLSNKLSVKFPVVLFSLISIVLLFTPIAKTTNWLNYFPEFIAAYFYNNTGSHFPLFPWLIYVYTGSMLGYYLSVRENIFLKKRFAFNLSSIGIGLIFISMFVSYINSLPFEEPTIWFSTFSLIALRLGYVILLNGIMAFAVRKLNHIPSLINEVGKKTLSIYVLHLIMLYGCAFFPGLHYYFGRSFNLNHTLLATFAMLSLMSLVVYFSNKLYTIGKQKFALTKI